MSNANRPAPAAQSADRAALIRRSQPSLSRAYSADADAIVDRFADLTADLADLPEAERLRLTAEMIRQLAGSLV